MMCVTLMQQAIFQAKCGKGCGELDFLLFIRGKYMILAAGFIKLRSFFFT